MARLHQTRTGFLTLTYASNYLTTDGQLKLTAVFPSVDKPAQEAEATPSVASKRTGTFGFLSSPNTWSVNNKGENHAKLRR